MQAQCVPLLIEDGPGPRRGSLSLQRAHLSAHLTHEVAEALEILLGRGEPALGALLSTTMLEHARGLLDDRAPILRAG